MGGDSACCAPPVPSRLAPIGPVGHVLACSRVIQALHELVQEQFSKRMAEDQLEAERRRAEKGYSKGEGKGK